MKTVSMHEAKTHLSRLVNLALAGEEVVIARHNRPMVRLTVVTPQTPTRKMGGLPNLIVNMDDTFDEPIEDWQDEPFNRTSRKYRRGTPVQRQQAGCLLGNAHMVRR
ncbi:MAG: type II toxin-antitoxin system prevent-host-death family antitoxin [Verrucomicrobia bacterium]|nr:type II toxin-antitoxin system prevent-host-death family antitoxin [Verrucomicrobiota bacterium]MCH8511857.1 type II toxin-antitoxin system prevent-host-death family antitoxin [Kiritimatiellia bacterium]